MGFLRAMAQQLQLNVELLSVAFTVIDSLEDECEYKETPRQITTEFMNLVSDESFAKLGAILPQNMVIAALDLIDRGNGARLDHEPYIFALTPPR